MPGRKMRRRFPDTGSVIPGEPFQDALNGQGSGPLVMVVHIHIEIGITGFQGSDHFDDPVQFLVSGLGKGVPASTGLLFNLFPVRTVEPDHSRTFYFLPVIVNDPVDRRHVITLEKDRDGVILPEEAEIAGVQVIGISDLHRESKTPG
jgi:hypothetical protein